MIESWTGNLVRLRALTRGDADTCASWESDPGLTRLESNPHWPVSAEQIQHQLVERAIAAGDEQQLGIELLNGDLIGIIGLHHTNRRHGTAELGILIGDRAAWGHGCGSEACRMLLHFAFEELGYQKINVSVYEFNTRALHLYQKLGFRHEGRRRRAIYTGGRYYDTLLLGLTREEFHEQEARDEEHEAGADNLTIPDETAMDIT